MNNKQEDADYPKGLKAYKEFDSFIIEGKGYEAYCLLKKKPN